MQVNMTNQICNQPNFQSAYIVHSVKIGDKVYKYGDKKVIHRVADALGKSMYENTLSSEMKQKVSEFFPDYKEFPFVRVARRANCHISQQDIVIMTALDAQLYYNERIVERNTHADNTNSQWVLRNIINRVWNKPIRISAEEKDGKLIITDIERVEKSHNVKKN